MKTKIIFALAFGAIYLMGNVNAQYLGCPNQGTDVIGHLNWRIRDATTNAIITGSLAPNTVYTLEIYETPYNSVPPNYPHYDNIGIKGSADGFKLYQNAWVAQNHPDNNYPDWVIADGVGPDVGSTGGVAVFGIKTLPLSDPNWTGEITAFKAYGMCAAEFPPGGATKFFLKTLVR